MTQTLTSVAGTELSVSGMNEKELDSHITETLSLENNSVFFGMTWARNYLERIQKERDRLDKQVHESVYYREWVRLRKMITRVSDFYRKVSSLFLERRFHGSSNSYVGW